ncbi:hypothetical protein HCZ30_03920 [Marivivens donghaensis]|uniref:DUF2125 domain-containing protein n=1 Tax=Marivivens donghaensis TaxID=1699413 RepID=A0ABX0VY62_9RHOB|nr:hypothetical protein [Marivivens donghaensis]NIY71578.1 hypothetical protein [Marivivens donghaensis]
MFNKLSPRSLALVAAVVPVPALADVTADDYLNMITEVANASGFEVTSDVSADGDVTTVENLNLVMTLPMDFGAFTMTVPSMTITEADGELDVVYGETMDGQLVITPPEDGANDLVTPFTMSMSNLSEHVTGDPDQMQIERTYDSIEAMSDMSDMAALDSMGEDVADIVSTYHIIMTDGSQTTTVSLGDMIIQNGSSTAAMLETTSQQTGGGADQTAYTSNENTTIDYIVQLPRQPLDLMNVAASIRAGLSVDMTSTSEKATTSQSMTFTSEATEYSEASSASFQVDAEIENSTSSFGIGEKGLSLDIGYGASTANIAGDMNGMPFDVSLTSEPSTVKMASPLMAAEDPQEFSIAIDIPSYAITSFEPQDMLMGFDVTEGENHLVVDISGEMTVMQDLLDIETMMGLEDTPVTVQSVSVNSLDLGLLGAMATAEGDFEFTEMMDPMTGMPFSVTGTAQVVVANINQLLSRLESTGMVPPNAGMMLGAFLRQEPQDGIDDRFVGDVELTPEGFTLNGMPF